MTYTKFTPGPWSWFGNAASNSLYLATVRNGRRYVMDFTRWGMRGAQPRFQPAQMGMIDAKNLLRFEVGDRDVIGVEAAKSNSSVYRYDVVGIDAPDAHLIAASPCLYTALAALVDEVQSGSVTASSIEIARKALKRAVGEK